MRLLEKFKEDSLDSAHLRFGGAIFAQNKKTFKKIRQDLQGILDRRPDDTELSDYQIMRKALNSADVHNRLRSTYERFSTDMLRARVLYYRDTKNRIIKEFNDSQPSFVTLKANKEERIVSHTFGSVPFRTRASRQRMRLEFRVDDLMSESYRKIEGDKRNFQARYREGLQGAFNRAEALMIGLSRDLFSFVYQNLEDDLMRSF